MLADERSCGCRLAAVMGACNNVNKAMGMANDIFQAEIGHSEECAGLMPGVQIRRAGPIACPSYRSWISIRLSPGCYRRVFSTMRMFPISI